ncbi:MAG: ATP-binding protein [Flavobacteriaceae bacterium]|nr:ATP-binding protein [Flavobacteriaceae bacterium]
MNRGEAEYFHGRYRERNAFSQFLEKSKKNQKGTSFLIQGPPGVGKTALWHQLAKDSVGWETIEINPTALYDLKEFRDLLGFQDWKKFYQREKIHFKAQALGFGVDVTIPINRHTFQRTLDQVKRPIILVLDEAQQLEKYHQQLEKRLVISEVLKNMHNIKTDDGFMVIFSGLSHTHQMLKDLDISRFASQSIYSLDCIDKLSEKNILKDYLIRGGGIDENHSRLNHWIRQLIQETQGYPEHITAYGQLAEQQLKDHDRSMDESQLNEVLRKGQQSRYEYYTYRWQGLCPQKAQALTFVIQKHQAIRYHTDVHLLQAFEKEGLSPKDASSLFQETIQRGIFAPVPGEQYQIPIPSMVTWVSEIKYPTYQKKPMTLPSSQLQKGQFFTWDDRIHEVKKVSGLGIQTDNKSDDRIEYFQVESVSDEKATLHPATKVWYHDQNIPPKR